MLDFTATTLLDTAITDEVCRDRLIALGRYTDGYLRPWVQAGFADDDRLADFLRYDEDGYMTVFDVLEWVRTKNHQFTDPAMTCLLHRLGITAQRAQMLLGRLGYDPRADGYDYTHDHIDSATDLITVLLATGGTWEDVEAWAYAGLFSFYDSNGWDTAVLRELMIDEFGQPVDPAVVATNVTARDGAGASIVEFLSRYPGADGPVAFSAGFGSTDDLLRLKAKDPHGWAAKFDAMQGLWRTEPVTGDQVFASAPRVVPVVLV